MRKQTKLVAVLSTAALLALGASMSSFAATGWQEENGTWVYYNRSGDKETEKWAKSGDNWFYLNDSGEMSTDVIVEYNDDYYYVDDNGAMVTNQWVSMENEDYDGGDDDEEPVNHWYYFGSNGKAYKSSTSSDAASFKNINGKEYVFDDEGKMLYGWINDDGERETGDDAWKEGIYYCGKEDDGAKTIGWSNIEIKDDDYDDAAKDGNARVSSHNTFDDEEQERWFWFKSNGKKQTSKDGKTINGKKYSFDEWGRMNAEWILWDATATTANATTATASSGQGANDYTREWRYFGSPEDGARITKGWFKVVPDENLHLEKYNDDEDFWYYSDNDGQLVAGEIKTINGKKYAFDSKGRMKSGMKFYKFEDNNPNKDIVQIIDDDDDDYPFDTEDRFKDNANHWMDEGYYLYYFGSGSDGSMKTNKQNVEIDGESFSFFFNKSGTFKGAGKTGVDDDKYYLAGMLLKADKDDKYSVVKIKETKDGGVTKTTYNILDTDEFMDDLDTEGKASADGKSWLVKDDEKLAVKDKYDEYYNVNYEAARKAGITYKLVNTSGTVQKNKHKAKDGDDRCYDQKGNDITSLYVES